MLWDAGQERIGRERQGRLFERFTAARDAELDVLVSTGRATPVGTWRLPPYARPASEQPVRSPAARDATLAKLAVMFPGIVGRTDS